MKDRQSRPCVELRKVVKRFPGVIAVDHVDLEIEQGKIFTLLGPSGCGKTTALRLVAGLETLDEGDILIDGKVMNDIPPHKRNCSTVFQSLALFPHMTVEGNIAYGLERRKTPKNEIRKAVGEMLALVGLVGMEKRRPSQLSGGQRQRVAVARSLVLKPRVLLLDEPLAALDRKLRKEMQVELKRIQGEVGITFLYVTHDQKEALAISDTIAVMRAGKLEQAGAPDEIYNTPRTKFIADFMGATNILSGKVIATGDGKLQLETDSGLQVIALHNEDKGSNEITGISVHPELIELLPSDAGLQGGNRFKGKVIEMIYQGDFIETKISLRQTGELLTAHFPSRLDMVTRLSPGEEVLIHWNPKSSNTLLA